MIKDDDIPYVKYGEAAMSIIDSVLSAVYEVRPDIVPDGENSLLYGETYYTLEADVAGIIQKCIDEDNGKMHSYTKSVDVLMDEDRLWVNSVHGCEVRINGIGKLKEIKSIKSVMHKAGTMIDIAIGSEIKTD